MPGGVVQDGGGGRKGGQELGGQNVGELIACVCSNALVFVRAGRTPLLAAHQMIAPTQVFMQGIIRYKR